MRLHVDAKRFLCATEPDYLARLSAASLHTLEVQGGPMSPDEVHRFRDQPHHVAAVALRRWDDLAERPDLDTPVFDHYRPLLAGLREREE